MRTTACFFGFLALSWLSPAGAASSLCDDAQTTLFSCPLRSHGSVSVCQSKSDPKQVQYRYGPSDKKDPGDLAVPDGKHEKESVTLLRRKLPTGEINGVIFHSGKISYTPQTNTAVTPNVTFILIDEGPKRREYFCDMSRGDGNLADVVKNLGKQGIKHDRDSDGPGE